MEIIRKKNQLKIVSDTCGELCELLNMDGIPVSVTQAINIKPTKAHYHKVGTEIYWVLDGKILVSVNGNKPVEINSGELLIISPMEIHEIVEASHKNNVIAINSPRWQKSDEYLQL